MSDTPFKDILAAESEEDPPGLTEEGYRKRAERLSSIQVELKNQRRAERRAKGLTHECEQMDQRYKVEKSDLFYNGWHLEDDYEVFVTIFFCPFCGVELERPK